ncbi:type III secretion system outer membrane ring subunit SctC [Limnobacter profundi]|uniref:Type III secretion system outer membrane ring subunit SctC n=1 Tax=Limnobacter profundi TaxID=2732163 RepID=A0ABX6N2R2_9BURK|nr:type III secretion system outer membrane ring subunit SctC [Limnobacter sp. SAORIC-580]QJR28356.1 type III secretion system outer membrane ring subunit SctC [Limnobacter sp. SAORIC-580]
MKKWIKAITLASLIMVQGAWLQAASAAKAEMRIYMAQEESSKRALETMLDMLGLRLNTNAINTRPISGKFEFSNVEELMAYFRSSFRINWFQNGTQVYVYRSDDWRTQKIFVGGARSNDDWKDLLTSAGLFYKEFPFAINSDTKELIVSGPRSYLNLLREAFEQAPPDPSEIAKHGIELMVFPLQYASVEDRQTTLRGATLTTPGALSVLLNLLGLPNQRMTASPENKKAGMIVDGAGQQTAGMGLLQGNNYRAQVMSPTTLTPPKEAPQTEKKEEAPVSVTADPRTNSILVRDAKSKFDYYKQLIDKLDRPLPMIEVEAMLVEVDQRGLNELGLEFGFQSSHLLYDFPGSGVNSPSLTIPGASTIVDPVRFLARLKALSADENAKVLARPTIVTQDNVSAYIDLSQTLYLQVLGERVADVVPVTAGSLLQVTPRLVKEGGDDRIFLRIEIQDGNITQNMQSAQSISAPSIQNTSLSTQALIQREKAILIGGYNRESEGDKDYRVPVLGSLPFIGAAFSSKQKQRQNVARLFLITPRLIEDPPHNSESTRAAINSLQKSFKLTGENLQPTPALRLDNRLEGVR